MEAQTLVNPAQLPYQVRVTAVDSTGSKITARWSFDAIDNCAVANRLNRFYPHHSITALSWSKV